VNEVVACERHSHERLSESLDGFLNQKWTQVSIGGESGRKEEYWLSVAFILFFCFYSLLVLFSFLAAFAFCIVKLWTHNMKREDSSLLRKNKVQ